MKFRRDYFAETPVEKDRYFRRWPLRGLVKTVVRAARVGLRRYWPGLESKWSARELRRDDGHARLISAKTAASYLSGRDYYEIQIGHETRPVTFVEPASPFLCERDVKSDEVFLFGVAPRYDEFDSRLPKSWHVSIVVRSLDRSELRREIEFPLAGRTECFAYHPENGWVDLRVDLKDFAGCRVNIEISLNVPGSISAPQILRKKSRSEVRNVLLLSGESLTDVRYLKSRYGSRVKCPNLDALMKESDVFPCIYSPADSTLAFAASVFSGLMPSQHAVGNYALMPYDFDNKVFSRDVPSLAERFKEEGFFTAFGATESRFSSKTGWARGFDHFFHIFEKWTPTVPQVDWVLKTFENLPDVDKFLFLHIDFLHEPLLTFHEADQNRFHDAELLATTAGDRTEDLYLAQLERFDRELGRLFQTLQARGEYESTAILLTGDHGAGIHWVKHCAYSLYEERVRVPLIVRYPAWAAGTSGVRPVGNSATEIHRAIHAMLGKPFPEFFKNLPQFDGTLSEYAFAETIMNPRHEYKRHALALVKTGSPYKYVCRHLVDWDGRKIEGRFEEKLFRWDEASSACDEEKDLSGENPTVMMSFREVAEKVLGRNVEFLAKHPPEAY